MGKKLNLLNKKINRLFILEEVGKNQKGEILYKCICDCGNYTIASGSNINRNKIKSCGCLQVEIAKQKKKSKYKYHDLKSEYNTWTTMKRRCYNENDLAYKYYGGKGITIYDKWLNDFDSFVEDMGKKPFKNAQIDRIDSDKGYYPDNCRWVTPHDNMLNIKYHKNWGIRKINNTYHVRVTRSYKTRYAKTKDIQKAIAIRDSWVKEYEDNRTMWIEKTLNNSYKMKENENV